MNSNRSEEPSYFLSLSMSLKPVQYLLRDDNLGSVSFFHFEKSFFYNADPRTFVKRTCNHYNKRAPSDSSN